jgi:xylulokinase
MPKYLLGIDLGTSSVRAGIFSEDSTSVATAAETYPIDTPAPDRAEQSPEGWWDCTCRAIRGALAQSGANGSDIAGISFSGQMHGGAFLDRDGNPVSPAIIWADSRSSSVLKEISGIIGQNRIEKILMNRMFTGTLAATMYWLQKYDTDTWRKIRHVLPPKDYIRFRMCGLYNTEPTDASATLLFDQSLRDWSDEILDALNIPVEFMPYVVNSDEHITETSGIEEACGIPDGIPLILGGADQTTSALANGVLNEGSMFAAIGTGGQIVAPMSMPRASENLSLNTFCHLPESRWYLLGATLSAGLCLRWYRDNFCPDIPFERLSEEAAATPAGADGLSFMPYLAGKRSPVPDPSAAGGFSGIRLMHSRGHFARAIMEGVVFELKGLHEVMLSSGTDTNRLIASGGWTNSSVWMQIMADSFALPLHVSSVSEPSCLGAALIAGIGTGMFESYGEASNAVPEPSRIIEPEPGNFDLYKEKYDIFKADHANRENNL